MSQKKWINIRKDLSHALELQARALQQSHSTELRQYENRYKKEFHRSWKVCQQKELFTEWNHADVVLIGDFHALQQSQKAHLRLLRSWLRSGAQPVKSFFVGLECFSSADQEKIDLYMSGRLTERDFLKAIQWQKTWGFPWENLRPLIRWLQKNKVKIFGLNAPSSEEKLQKRDHHAAKIINRLLRTYPQSKAVVIFGDLHLASSHLPKALNAEKKISIVRVFQNSEKIYFDILEKSLDPHIDIVKLAKKDFCVLNVPPWVKWQNYLMYLEKTYDRSLRSVENEIDYTDHVGRFVKIMAHDLNCQLSLSGLSVYSAQDSTFWKYVKKKLSSEDLKTVKYFIESQKSFYLPEQQMAYLARASVNHASALAILFIRHQLVADSHNYLKMPEDFLRQIWINTVAYVGSKLINPKRKTDTLFDIKKAMLTLTAADIESEALKLALSQKMRELMILSTGNIKGKMIYRPKRHKSYFVAAEILGGMLGEKIYYAFRKKIMSLDFLKMLILKDVNTPFFEIAYYEILEVIEALPEPFKSKRDRL